MSLSVKLWLLLALACALCLIGLAPAFLALSLGLSSVADLSFSGEQPPPSGALEDRLRFAQLALAPAAVSVCAVILAVGLIGQRQIVRPLNRLLGSLPKDLFPAPTPDLGRRRGGQIERLKQTFWALSERLDQTSRAQKSETEHLIATAQLADHLTSLAADFVWETDAEGRLTGLTGDLDFGPGAPDLVGHSFPALMSVALAGDTARPLELTSRRPLDKLLCRFVTEDGETRFCRLSALPRLDTEGQFYGYAGIGHDVTAQITADQHREVGGVTDPLTGLASAGQLQARITQALAARLVLKGDVAIIHLDLDRFKHINDSLGHAVGDLALCEVAARLTALAGPQDTVARIGGDAFAILQANGAQPEAAEHLCLAILTALREPLSLRGHSVSLTGSLGCAIAEQDTADALPLLRNADIAMYSAKDAGRDTYRLHEAAVTDALQSRITMERELRLAVQNGAIDVFYQPVMHTARDGLAGFETRIRWPRPGHGMVYPETFLTLAEDTGLIVPLSAHVLATACRTAMSWPNLSVAVKLSPLCFRHEGLLGTIVTALRDSNLSAQRLELEITEAALLGATDTAMFQFDALRELGVRLVMDKFGSGSSSLQHLQRYPFDKLKLDRSFVAGVDTDQATAEIVRSVLQLAAALGMATSADGVSNADQAMLLGKLGCQTVQAPYLGKARSADQAFEMVRREGIMPGAQKAKNHL